MTIPRRGIAKFPPELVTDGSDFNGARRRHGLLNRMNNASGGEEKHQDDKDGNDGPGEFDLIAPIDLGRLAAIIGGAVAKLSLRHKQEEKRRGQKS